MSDGQQPGCCNPALAKDLTTVPAQWTRILFNLFNHPVVPQFAQILNMWICTAMKQKEKKKISVVFHTSTAQIWVSSQKHHLYLALIFSSMYVFLSAVSLLETWWWGRFWALANRVWAGQFSVPALEVSTAALSAWAGERSNWVLCRNQHLYTRSYGER